MNYGQGFLTGLIMSVIIAFLSPVVQLLITFVISPEYFPNIIEYSVSSGQMTFEEAQAMFNLETYMWQGALGALAMGIATALIVALFTMKKVRRE